LLAIVAVLGCGKPAGHHDDAAPPGGEVVTGAQHHLLYVGGYGPDLGWAPVAADGTLGALATTPAFAGGPSFLAATPAMLYAVSESDSRVGAYAIDPTSGALAYVNDVPSGGNGPAHLSVDPSGRFVLVANYGDGAIAVLAAGATLAAPHQTLAAGANAHMIVLDPSGRFAFVPCLGSDYVAQYLFDATSGMLSPNNVPHFATAPGAGPRHLAFAPDGAHAYLVNEKASTLTALALDPATGRLAELQTVSTRAAGATGKNTSAEIWVHPSGDFVFGSNRGDDNIATFSIDRATGRVTLAGHTPTGGRTPRDFTLDPAGTHLYVANQNSNSILAFTIDAATGALAPLGDALTATMPTFVGVVTLP
jgi:6-phosphogluconolactonase